MNTTANTPSGETEILSNLLAQEKDMAAALMPLEPNLFAAANVAARPPDSLESSPHSEGHSRGVF